MVWFAIVKKFTNIAMFVWKFGIWFGRNLAERIRRSTARPSLIVLFLVKGIKPIFVTHFTIRPIYSQHQRII